MTDESPRGLPRPRPPADLEQRVIEPLKEHGYFRHKYEVMTFAAALGLRVNAQRPVGAAGEGIRLEYFQSAGQDLCIDVIGIEADPGEAKSATDRLAMIDDDRLEERVQIFERHAAAGLELLRDECFGPAGDVMTGILRLIEKYALSKSAGEDELERAADEVASLT